MSITIQDVAALIVSVVLVVGLIVLSALGEGIPVELGTVLGASATWLFMRSTQYQRQRQDTELETKLRESFDEEPPKKRGK